MALTFLRTLVTPTETEVSRRIDLRCDRRRRGFNRQIIWLLSENLGGLLRHLPLIRAYNCTSRGAYLVGWTHLSLAEHPIMKHRVKKPSQKQYFSLIGMQAGIIAAELRSAVDQLGAELKNAAQP